MLTVRVVERELVPMECWFHVAEWAQNRLLYNHSRSVYTYIRSYRKNKCIQHNEQEKDQFINLEELSKSELQDDLLHEMCPYQSS